MSPADTGGRTRRRVFVTGRVQAVGFRASCLQRAVDAGLSGWVRNTPDGAVEAVFEGSPNAVDALVTWCRTGPPMARVTHVDVLDEGVRGDAGFIVR